MVTYVLTPEGTGTRLDFEHSGVDLTHPGQRAAYDAMSGGWKSLERRLLGVLAELAGVTS